MKLPLTTGTGCAAATGCTGIFNVNTPGTGGTSATGQYPFGIAVDPNQNIWVADFGTAAAGSVTVLQNTGAVATPSYQGEVGYTTSGAAATGTTKATTTFLAFATGQQSLGVAFTPSTAAAGYAAMVSENTTTAGQNGITAVTPTVTTAAVTALAAGTLLPGVATGANTVGLYYDAADGLGNLFTPNQGGNGLMFTNNVIATPTNYALLPCVLLTSTATGCTSTVPSSPRGITLDSTGSVWLFSGTKGFVQIIGPGAPTNPLLSLGKVGRP